MNFACLLIWTENTVFTVFSDVPAILMKWIAHFDAAIIPQVLDYQLPVVTRIRLLGLLRVSLDAWTMLKHTHRNRLCTLLNLASHLLPYKLNFRHDLCLVVWILLLLFFFQKFVELLKSRTDPYAYQSIIYIASAFWLPTSILSWVRRSGRAHLVDWDSFRLSIFHLL